MALRPRQPGPAVHLGEIGDLAARMGMGLREPPGSFSQERMLVAVDHVGAPCTTVLQTPRTATPWGRRFEVARAIGHALLDPERAGAIGAASTRWAQQARRRRSGAFAAEFLLPAPALSLATQGVLDRGARGDVFEDVMHRFGVGARTAAHQLNNHGLLSSTAARDELIELYARRG